MPHLCPTYALPMPYHCPNPVRSPLGWSNRGMAIQFNSNQFNSTQFNSIQINSIHINSIQFKSIQFKSIQFKSIQINSIQFNPIKSIPCKFIQSNSIQFKTIQINSTTDLLALTYWPGAGLLTYWPGAGHACHAGLDLLAWGWPCCLKTFFYFGTRWKIARICALALLALLHTFNSTLALALL